MNILFRFIYVKLKRYKLRGIKKWQFHKEKHHVRAEVIVARMMRFVYRIFQHALNVQSPSLPTGFVPIVVPIGEKYSMKKKI